MSRMIATVLSSPQVLPSCAVDGPGVAVPRLRLRIGADEIEVQVPAEVEAMTWLGEVLQEAADRVHKEAEEIFRELRRYPRAEDEKGHQEVPQ